MNSTPIIRQTISTSAPPFPERLQVDRGGEKQIMLPNYDFLDELKNVCIKIPLLQAIKEISILAKTIKELSIKKPGRKAKETKKNSLGRKNSRYNDWKNFHTKICRSRKSNCENTYQWS